MAERNAIEPTRAQNYPEWYQQVIRAADMAELSPVRGCMVIKPWGYGIWENMRRVLDERFKATGHRNAYFPLFIPLSFIQKEAEHVEGFAKECAVVTHHRLQPGPDGKLAPAGELEEPLVVRPTSETIIGAMYAKWVQSYRDLPLLLNQWANIVRWEMRTRIFLRTTEFLWQEGHTAHAAEAEARAETDRMLRVYADFAERYMAMPVIMGRKTDAERFPGAVETYSIEAMMQDGKALQAGTSHFLGQNFARASGIKFLDQDGAEKHAWTTSWGVSTRLVGGLIMTHGDDNGLMLPPRLAPTQVVILPVIHKDDTRAQVLEYCGALAAELRRTPYDGRPLAVEIDDRDMRGGEKTWSWIKKGVPVRLEVGPRDIAAGVVSMTRRDLDARERRAVPRAEIVAGIAGILDEIQANLLQRARDFRAAHTREIDTRDEFYDFFKGSQDKLAGFVMAHWAGDPAVEKKLREELAVTVRCIPLDGPAEPGTCPFTGAASPRRVVFARAY